MDTASRDGDLLTLAGNVGVKVADVRDVRIRLETFTKQEAETLLGHGLPNNRPPGLGTVAKYRRMMDDGHWVPSPDAVICVDPAGRLLNGQHRLRAFVESRLTRLDAYVARNVPPKLAFYFDQGKKRTSANQLSMCGYANANNLAAASRKLWFYEVNGGPASGSEGVLINNNDVLEILREHNPALERCVVAAQAFYKASDHMAPVSSVAVLMYLFGRVDENARTVFFSTLERGTKRGGEGPIHVLRRTLRIAQTERRRLWGNSAIGEALIIKAWNAWRGGRRIDLLSFKDSEEFPKIAGTM